MKRQISNLPLPTNKIKRSKNMAKSQENRGKVKLFNKGQKKSKIFKNLRKQEY